MPTGELELAYELAYFVAGHPSTIDGVKKSSADILEQLDEQLPEHVRQAAIARAQSCDLDAYCARLLSECETYNDRH